MTEVRAPLAAAVGALILILSACSGTGETAEEASTERPGPVAASELDARLEPDARALSQWRDVVTPYLAQDLWTADEAYDAGSVLMIPLEAAFRSDNESWRQQFDDHFARFSAADQPAVAEYTLDRLQYLYLASRYLAFSASSDPDEEHRRLAELLRTTITELWTETPAWQWGRDPFPTMRDRVVWKLDHDATEPSYLRAMIDEELFTLAIAAEYSAYERSTDVPQGERSTAVADMVETSRRMVDQEGTWTEEGGWLFQVGVWADHPDYAFAGYESAPEGSEGKARTDVAPDSSHSARWPVWLRSFAAAQEDPADREELLVVLAGLSRQFVDEILVPPGDGFSGLRMNNYTDGWNGVYRWNYATAGQGNGYRAHELSGSLFALWWGLLPGRETGASFCEAVDTFPLDQQVLRLYTGPNTTRERNPLTTWPAFFTNGFAELEARLACGLAST